MNKEPIDLKIIAERNSLSITQVIQSIELIKSGMKALSKRIPVVENGVRRYLLVERSGLGCLKTAYGTFWEYEFTVDDNWETYSVIVKGDIDMATLNPQFKNKENLVLRIDSGCKTGQVFGDLTCECKDQLQLAMEALAAAGEGIIINIPKQDGRGMGINFKLGTLWLQELLNVDTYESASILAPGGVIDIRTYSGVIGILEFLEIPKTFAINLASNNPHKAEIFPENGYTLGNRVPMVIRPTKLTEKHLKAKQEKLGHVGLIS